MKKLFLTALIVFVVVSSMSVFVEDSDAQNDENVNDVNTLVNINNETNQAAKDIYDDKSLALDKNVKNFVVLIPNEAHESINQDKDQYPLANQAYIPTELTINTGTAVTWLNGDVDHEHVIKFQPGNPQNLAETNQFAFPEYITVVFNQSGSYPYYEDNVNENDESFVMEGTINVVDPKTENLTNPNNINSIQDSKSTIMGVLMVPLQDFETIKSDLENSGIRVLSDHSFTDLRGGQEGTGPTQSILVWGSNSSNIDDAIAPIIDITSGLPYS